MGWCGGAGSRLGEDAEVGRPSKKVGKASYSLSIDIQSRKWVISTKSKGLCRVCVLTSRSGNHQMAPGGHQWTRIDLDAFV